MSSQRIKRNKYSHKKIEKHKILAHHDLCKNRSIYAGLKATKQIPNEKQPTVGFNISVS